MLTSSDSTKICVSCKQKFEATLVYFFRDRDQSDGLRAACKRCICGSFVKTETVISCVYCNKSYPAVARYFKQFVGATSRLGVCHKCSEAHPEPIVIVEKSPVDTQDSARINSTSRKNSASRQNKRQTKIDSMPNSFPDDDWAKCVTYWQGKCAYCGKAKRKLHADHYIPVASAECPGTIPENILPSCESCNLSKQDADPAEWVSRKFGKDKATLIHARIEQYFASLHKKKRTFKARQEQPKLF